ncbi:MAG: putative peptidoglycan glycosyltransferase FtsW [Pseudomonadota bacterium]
MTDMVFGSGQSMPQDPYFPKWWRSVDRWTLSAILSLFAIGMVLGLAASVPLALRNDLHPYFYVNKQAFFGGIALLMMLWVSTWKVKTIRRWSILGFVIGLIALALLPWLGTDFNKGAVRWYSLGFASVQPSEFLKPAFVVFAAWLMAASFKLGGPPGQRLAFGTCLVVMGLLVIQPDFGQASLVLFSWVVMYFVAGAPIFLLIAVIVMTSAGAYLAYTNSEHVQRRIDGFLNQEIDPTTQIGYATNAIQEGGIFGAGIGGGSVKYALPDAHTDFIIAVAAEEYGLVAVIVIIGLFAVIAIRSFMRLMAQDDIFVRLAGTGLAALFAMQAIINMGVAVRLFPAKGMTLPFVSYGGSSVVAAGIAMGMLLAFTRTKPTRDADLIAKM